MSKVIVFLCEYDRNGINLDFLLANVFLPANAVHQKCLSHKTNPEVLLQHLLGRYLLSKALEYYSLSSSLLSQINYTHFGKPYFRNHDLHFNITHSAGIVACCTSPYTSVGIDLEPLVCHGFNELKNTMSRAQWESIHASPRSDQAFLRFWTAKEALLKAEGSGLVDDLASVPVDFPTVLWKGWLWHFHSFDIDDRFIGFVVSTRPIIKINRVVLCPF